jgi:hypothetical protein
MPHPDLQLTVLLSCERNDSGAATAPVIAVPCHSFILVLHSDCFAKMLGKYREMLRVHTDPADEGKGVYSSRHIDMFAPSHRCVKHMLSWMYTGTDVTNGDAIMTGDECGNSAYANGNACRDLQEVVDLLLLSNEYLVTRLQKICEHRIGQVLLHQKSNMCPKEFSSLVGQLLELGEALGLTTLLSYASQWTAPLGGEQCHKPSNQVEAFDGFDLLAKHEMGYLDGKNADFPFLILVILSRVQSEHTANTLSNTNSVVYLQHFLTMETNNADNYYSKSVDVIDLLVEAFPVILSYDDESMLDSSTDEIRAQVEEELGNFHCHNKKQRIYMLQSIIMMNFSSLVEMACYVFEKTESNDSESNQFQLTERLSNKLYWFLKRHTLLQDMIFTVDVDNQGCVRDTDDGLGCGRDLVLLLDSDCVVEGDAHSSSSNGDVITHEAFRVHKAVLASGSGKLESILRLKASTSSTSLFDTIHCNDVEPVCIRSLMFLLYCNYLPPVTFDGERVHLVKFYSAITTSLHLQNTPFLSQSLRGGSTHPTAKLAVPYYMHLADFADEYLVHPQMMHEAERQLRSLLTTQNSGQIYVLARGINLDHLACSSAVYFLYGYADLMKVSEGQFYVHMHVHVHVQVYMFRYRKHF